MLLLSCVFVADGVKKELRLRVALSGSCYAETGKSRGFARCGALGLPGAGHVVAACLGVDLSKPEWCFVRWLQFGQNLVELAHGVSPGHTDILILEHEEIAIPRPGFFLPRSAQVQLGQCLLIGQMVALGLDDDYLIRLRRKKKRSFPFTPLGKLRKLGNVTLSVVDF